MTSFCLVGTVTEKPSIETAKNGSNFVRLKINVTKSSEGETELFEIFAWKNLSEIPFDKGQLLCITGRLLANNYDKEGATYYNTRLVAEKIDLYK